MAAESALRRALPLLQRPRRPPPRVSHGGLARAVLGPHRHVCALSLDPRFRRQGDGPWPAELVDPPVRVGGLAGFAFVLSRRLSLDDCLPPPRARPLAHARRLIG